MPGRIAACPRRSADASEMRVRGCIAAGAAAGFVLAGACLFTIHRLTDRLSGGGTPDPDSALTPSDRYEVLDGREHAGYRYVLVRVWTTSPDFMQRVDLYCYQGATMVGEPERKDFRHSRQVLSENLADDWHRLEGGGYDARVATRGVIDVRQKRITIEFDKGATQLISLPDERVHDRCRTSR